MVLRVSGKNFDIGEALRTHVRERVEAAVARFFEGSSVTGHVILDHEGSGYRTDCTLHLATGVTLHAEGRAQEPYASFDQAADRLERRLSRHKKRLKERHATAPNITAQVAGDVIADYVIQGPEDDEVGGDFHPLVIAERTSAMKTMPVSDAVIELDLTGAPVQVFRHATNGRVNLVYRRPDGNIGWIDPGAPDGASGRLGS